MSSIGYIFVMANYHINRNNQCKKLKTSTKYGDIRNLEMLVNQLFIEPLPLIAVEDTTEEENKILYLKKLKMQLQEADKHKKKNNEF